MQRSIEQKEQNRQGSDADVRLDVAAVQHFFGHDSETFSALAEGEQREFVKTVAIDWSSLSVRGSCLLRLERRRTGISSIKFFSVPILRISPQRQVSSSAHDQIVNTCSNPERFLAHIHKSSGRSQEISTNQQEQVFRRNHAENDSALLASNKNGSRYAGRKDQRTIITKFVSLSFTSFIDLVFQTKVFQQALVICPPVRAGYAEETSSVDDSQSEV